MKTRLEGLSFSPLAVAWLLLLAGPGGARAACRKVDNPELLEYSCEGGSAEDLRQVPDGAEKIRASGMPVGRLAEGQLSRFAELMVFACSHCQIGEIEDGAFRRLRNLQQLSLDNNQLKEVRAAWFEGLLYLTYLDLNYNAIERVDADVFRNAPELVDLRLSGNRLLCLDLEALARLRDLKRVFINENPGFGCPNALKRFLAERGVDFEADPQWASVAQDRVHASVPEFRGPPPPPAPAPAPAEERYPPSSPPPPTFAPRPPYVPPEMIQPSAPQQDFPLQGPYYAPKVNQQLDSYRLQAQQELERGRDALANATLPPPSVLLAGHQLPPPGSTECPNAAPARLGPPAALLLLPLLLALRC